MAADNSVKSYVKSLRYRYPGLCTIYVSFQNESDHGFYGTWIDDPKIEAYFDYQIIKTEKMGDIRKVWLKGYTDGLGIESMARKKAGLI